MADPEQDETAAFYEFVRRATLGARVEHREDGRRGHIVKRGGRQWTTRDCSPRVRWDGTIPAEAVQWKLLRVRNG